MTRPPLVCHHGTGSWLSLEPGGKARSDRWISTYRLGLWGWSRPSRTVLLGRARPTWDGSGSAPVQRRECGFLPRRATVMLENHSSRSPWTNRSSRSLKRLPRTTLAVAAAANTRSCGDSGGSPVAADPALTRAAASIPSAAVRVKVSGDPQHGREDQPDEPIVPVLNGSGDGPVHGSMRPARMA